MSNGMHVVVEEATQAHGLGVLFSTTIFASFLQACCLLLVWIMKSSSWTRMRVCNVCNDDLVEPNVMECMVCKARCRRCGGSACGCGACPVAGWWKLNEEMADLCRNPWFASAHPIVCRTPSLYKQTCSASHRISGRCRPRQQLARLRIVRHWIGVWVEATHRNQASAQAFCAARVVRSS